MVQITSNYNQNLDRINNTLAGINHTLSGINATLASDDNGDKSKGFIKLQADTENGIVDITLNTSEIYSYIPWSGKGSKAKTKLTMLDVSTNEQLAGNEFMYVLETKAYMDSILT